MADTEENTPLNTFSKCVRAIDAMQEHLNEDEASDFIRIEVDQLLLALCAFYGVGQ